MIRKIIHIDEEKCNGCGICANACHEGAIDMVDGKAKLVRENFCDGFGDCLPTCPAGAITFEEREAPAYDEAAVKRAQEDKMSDNENKGFGQAIGASTNASTGNNSPSTSESRPSIGHFAPHAPGFGCPGSRLMQFDRSDEDEAEQEAQSGYGRGGFAARPVSRLNQWPCQIKLLPTRAPFYDGAKLLIAADCTAYAYANMHEDFMKGKITLIGCPKLDAVDYSEKLTEIIAENDVKSVTIVRMEVPCCGGLQRAAEIALRNSGKFIPWQVVTISRDGRILD